MPARPSDTIFFMTATLWRPFARVVKGGRGNSEPVCRVCAVVPGMGNESGACVWGRRAHRARPAHICLDSVGRQAIVVPFRGQLAQMDRALASGAKGHRFESCIAHHATLGGAFAARRKRPFCVRCRFLRRMPPSRVPRFFPAFSLLGPFGLISGPVLQKNNAPWRLFLSVFPDANDRARPCVEVTHLCRMASRHIMRLYASCAPAWRRARKPPPHKANGRKVVLLSEATVLPGSPLCGWARLE